MALSESILQMRLAQDVNFQTRLQYILCQQARVVLAETGVGATHTVRANYARQVLNNPGGSAIQAAITVVGGVNVIGTVTEEVNGVTTSVTDGALLSQVATFWNQLAGIDTGN